MLWLFRFAIGFLKIDISGDFSEQILNLAAKNRITLWNLHCRKRHITGCISIDGFRRLRAIRRGTGVRVHILSRSGAPFLLQKYRHRFGFFAGAVLFFAVLEIMSCFVWTVNVSGNLTVSEREIITCCEALGITTGRLKSSIDTAAGPQRLMLRIPEIAWASMNIEGSVLTVNISEVHGKPDTYSDKPSNLKADADGIIEKIDVVSGNVLVHVGDTVKRGDLLVSGIVEGASDTRFVASVGTVTARTQREFSVSGCYEEQLKNPTGRVCRHTVLEVFGLRVPLYIGRISGDYRASVHTEAFRLFGKKMPLSLTTLTCEMTETVIVRHDREALLKLLYQKLENEIARCGITAYTLSGEAVTEDADGLTLQCIVTAHENIAVRELILVQ